MPQLPNTKRERYARYLAQGDMTQNEAYAAAGYTPNSGNANTLAKSPEVVGRIKELKREFDEEKIQMRLKMAEAGLDPNSDLGQQTIEEWTADLVRTMFAKNAQLAQVSGDFKSANESLTKIGDSLGMFDKSGGKSGSGNEARTQISIVGVQQAIGTGSDGVGLLPEEERNPLAPKLPSPSPAKRLSADPSVD